MHVGFIAHLRRVVVASLIVVVVWRMRMRHVRWVSVRIDRISIEVLRQLLELVVGGCHKSLAVALFLTHNVVRPRPVHSLSTGVIIKHVVVLLLLQFVD